MAIPGLNAAELERLALLLEELGEAQQAIGKILRHGYESRHPSGGATNRVSLEAELGDVCAAIALMCEAGDLRDDSLQVAAVDKLGRVDRYLHHQESCDLSAALDRMV